MENIEKIIKSIRLEHPECTYHGYKTDNNYLYIFLHDTNYSTGDGVNIVRIDLKTGEKEESCGFIVAVADWGLSLSEGWRDAL